MSRRTLMGMRGVHVIVEDLQPSLKDFGSNVGHQYDRNG